MKKRVFVHAYMQGNLGDDLMVRTLCDRYPSVQFLMCADDTYKARFGDLKNVRIFSPSDKSYKIAEKVVRKFKGTTNGMWKTLIKIADATVHIGGSVFVQHQDDFAPAYNVDYDLRRRSKRLYVVGANFGPYTDEKYYEAYKELFKEYEGICFRDEYSKAKFENYSNIKYAPDVVFNYKFSKMTEQRKEVVFSIIAMEGRSGKYSICQYTEDYYRIIAKMADIFAGKGYKINFVSFCKFEGDEEAIEKITSLISENKKKYINKIYYDKDVRIITEAFSRSEIIVGTRFHSIILGWLAGKKVLPIVYSPKTKHTLEDNKCELYLEVSGLSEISEQELFSLVERVENSVPFNVTRLKERADTQFEDLDKFLL